MGAQESKAKEESSTMEGENSTQEEEERPPNPFDTFPEPWRRRRNKDGTLKRVGCHLEEAPNLPANELVVWADSHDPKYPDWDDPPPQLRGWPRFLKQPPAHRIFCESLVMCDIEGRSKLYRLWQLKFDSINNLRYLLGLLPKFASEELMVRRVLDDLKVLPIGLVAVERQGADYEGYYLAKMFWRQQAGLAFCIQILGTR